MPNDRDPLDFDDETLDCLTGYEREARADIIEWRSADDDVLSSAVEAVQSSVGSAFTKITPEDVRMTLETAIEGGLGMVQDGARFTFRVGSVLEAAQSEGLRADQVTDLRGEALEDLNRLAQSYHTPNKYLAALEGRVCGLGGPGTAAADLPLLFGIACRAVQQVGTCYGFNMDAPDVRPVVLSVFNVGAGASSAAKARFLLDLHVAAEAFAKRWTYQKVAERTVSGGAAQALKQMTRRLPQKIARKVTKQKLAQALPVLGAAVGATFNYAFLNKTLTAARRAFQTLYLTGKYGPGSPPDAGAALLPKAS